jgi:filamentous hemagglutinin family protein
VNQTPLAHKHCIALGQKNYILLPLVACLFLLKAQANTSAQIVPDASLPNNSVVTPGCTSCTITGGTTAGTNLYHSFSQFSVPTGGQAFFNNALTIQNIITRVTGGSTSNIDGLIRANGTANVFLLNPNGIIFGPNASLNLGGSFVASTANSMKFSDGSEFSATAPQTPPLLTVSVPIGLQYGPNAGPIVVQGSGNKLTLNSNSSINRSLRPAGLKVQSGQTLALIGGDVGLAGGNLTANGGNIVLGSVKDNGLVTFAMTNPNWTFNFQSMNTFGDINLSQAASLDVSASGGGRIQVQSRNLTLTGGSAMLATTLGNGQGRGISVNTTESVQVLGFSGTATSPIFPSSFFTDASTATTTTARGGDLNISTGLLRVTDGAQVLANTLGLGTAGNLNIQAQTIELLGRATGFGGSSIASNVLGASTRGNAGNVNINAEQILVTGSANISASTRGIGNAGNLNIKSQVVELSGAVGTIPSNFSANGFIGNGGILTIETDYLRVADGAQILFATTANRSGNAGTLNIQANAIDLIGTSTNLPSGLFGTVREGSTGKGGSLIMNANSLRILDGAQIAVATRGLGNAGDLIVNAGDIEIGGSASQGKSGLFATALVSTGSGGALNVTADNLFVRDGAIISVSNFPSVGSTLAPGQGSVGNMTINARIIQLDNGSGLSAQSAGGDRGNITLNSDLIVLRRGSSISTNALGSATGGNITIATKFLVAVAKENSDITANAQNNFGGQVRISALGIFGIQPRVRLTPLSDITASSALGPQFNGLVTINTPDLDPGEGLVQLPTGLVDASNQIKSACSQISRNALVVSGRGGVPEMPEQALNGETVWQDFRLADESSEMNQQAGNYKLVVPSEAPTRIVEAQGWVIDEKGLVTLVADMPQATSTVLSAHTGSVKCVLVSDD